MISLLNMPICIQGMQRTWWPEAHTIIVTGPYWMRSWKVTCMSDLWIFFLIFDTRLCRGLPLGKISFWLLFYMIPDLECLCWHKKSHSSETWCIPHKYRFFCCNIIYMWDANAIVKRKSFLDNFINQNGPFSPRPILVLTAKGITHLKKQDD